MTHQFIDQCIKEATGIDTTDISEDQIEASFEAWCNQKAEPITLGPIYGADTEADTCIEVTEV